MAIMGLLIYSAIVFGFMGFIVYVLALAVKALKIYIRNNENK